MHDREGDLALALQHHSAGRLDEAAGIYQRLHAADRRDSEVIFLMGLLCNDLGLFDSARQFLEDALAVAGVFPEARAQLVVALNGSADLSFGTGQLAQARRTLQRALELAPHDAGALQGLGRVALAEGDPATAEARLAASLSQQPDRIDALNWLGLARLQLGNYPGAEAALRDALRLRCDLHQARNNLGLALHNQGRLGEALGCFEEVLAHEPGYQNARINLANTLRILGRHARARRELEQIIDLHPDAADALNNLGAVLQDQGQSELALATLGRALALAPESPPIRWNLALSQLQSGDFPNGWSNFEARWEGCDHLRGGYCMPRQRAWRGEPLQGKRLLLWAEQGFGDTIQFIRFAQDVAALGATVGVMVPPELADLVRSAPGVTAVSIHGAQPPPAYDFHCPLLSLPHRLGISTDAGRLHGASPYLNAPQNRTLHWRRRVGCFPGLKVGLVWAGNARRQSAELAAIDARRSIALDRLAPILTVRNCSFFSLQKGAAGAALGVAAQGAARHVDLGRGRFAVIQDFSDELWDFSETAALASNLDLIISVDTAVAHLAGALGTTIWLLNRYDSCWRWLQGRDDSPWYGCLRQFRQPRAGAWDEVIDRAAAALAAAAAANAALAAAADVANAALAAATDGAPAAAAETPPPPV
jgi:tetratricopeptide (TPR) repeat protein